MTRTVASSPIAALPSFLLSCVLLSCSGAKVGGVDSKLGSGDDQAPVAPESEPASEGKEIPPTPSESDGAAVDVQSSAITQGALDPKRPEYRDLSFSEANNAFALDLYRTLGQSRGGNVALSPVSISVALSMTAAGASGETKKEMETALRFSDMKTNANLHAEFSKLLKDFKSLESNGNQVSVANRLYGQTGDLFLEPFQNLLQSEYQAPFVELDFAVPERARGSINSWVEKQTKTMIPELLKPGALTEQTRLVLVNAVYLKAQWKSAFGKKETREASFDLAPGVKKMVPMMRQKAKLEFFENSQVKLVSLPYKGERMSMWIVVPQKRHALSEIEASLTLSDLREWGSQLRPRDHVKVNLPRFVARSSFDLPIALQSLGMRKAFSLGAEFGGMTATDDFYLSQVMHEAVVAVDEKGTVAAAATAAVAVTKSLPKTFEITADHPYLYLIRDTATGSLLFLGRVVDPTN